MSYAFTPKENGFTAGGCEKQAGSRQMSIRRSIYRDMWLAASLMLLTS